jgi:hypothetical protein
MIAIPEGRGVAWGSVRYSATNVAQPACEVGSIRTNEHTPVRDKCGFRTV